jgi:uncharacterized membrane protein
MTGAAGYDRSTPRLNEAARWIRGFVRKCRARSWRMLRVLRLRLAFSRCLNVRLGGIEHSSWSRTADHCATLALSWLFSNTVYALHYAHLFYTDDASGKDSGGIDVPKCDEPDYWDFLYFSFTLGMTFQTSDVEITSAPVRRTTIGHSLAAFVFNIGVLAFTINVLGG